MRACIAAGAALTAPLLAVSPAVADAGVPAPDPAAAAVAVPCTPAALVAAITAANAEPAADRLVLATGCTYTLTTVDNTFYGYTGLPAVTSDITIAADGARIERDAAAPPFRLFVVDTTGRLALQGLTLRGGLARGGDGGDDGGDDGGGGGGGAGLGGAVYNRGELRLSSTSVTGNEARGGHGGASASNTPANDNGGGAGGGGLGGDGGSSAGVVTSIEGGTGGGGLGR